MGFNAPWPWGRSSVGALLQGYWGCDREKSHTQPSTATRTPSLSTSLGFGVSAILVGLVELKVAASQRFSTSSKNGCGQSVLILSETDNQLDIRQFHGNVCGDQLSIGWQGLCFQALSALMGIVIQADSGARAPTDACHSSSKLLTARASFSSSFRQQQQQQQ